MRPEYRRHNRWIMLAVFFAAIFVLSLSPMCRAASPEFVPVSEELSPLKKIISVSVKSSTLSEVLYVIAEATGLNLVMEKGVNPEAPVTMTLKNISAEDALKTVFESVDYFYSIKENMLVVRAMDTRIFEFGQTAVIQDYTVNVGGDIIGGATGTTGTTGSTGGSSGTSTLKGNVSQNLQADKEAFKLWDSIENSIVTILGISSSGATTGTTTGTQGAGTGACAQASQAQQTQTQTVQGTAQAVQPQAARPGCAVNRLTGTIVVTASKKDIEKVENYLAGIRKVLNRQVIIEARIVEVYLGEGLKYGIDWSALDMGKLGQVNVGTTNFSNIASPALGSPAFQLGVTKWNFTGLLQALQSQGDVKVLSNPRVNIMNGQTALLSVGRNETYLASITETIPTNTTVNTGTPISTNLSTFTTTSSNVLSGLMLGIVPYINENGDVTMTITPIISKLLRMKPQKVGVNIIEAPITDIRELSTTVKVRDGQMVIIGGLIDTKEALWDNQVPFLGNIPFLGSLFKSRDKASEKTELIIMLKPVIVTQ